MWTSLDNNLAGYVPCLFGMCESLKCSSPTRQKNQQTKSCIHSKPWTKHHDVNGSTIEYDRKENSQIKNNFGPNCTPPWIYCTFSFKLFSQLEGLGSPQRRQRLQSSSLLDIYIGCSDSLQQHILLLFCCWPGTLHPSNYPSYFYGPTLP